MSTKPVNNWPELPLVEQWEDTLTTVHMWTQIIGKIRLELSPWINHSWGSTLYVTAQGLTTSSMPYNEHTLEIDFNFIDHQLEFTTSQGSKLIIELKPMPVAEFYKITMNILDELGVRVRIFARPVEVDTAIPFEEDFEHASYDADAVNRFWQALVQADRVFKKFRAGFIGKSSPVHFFWGAFDLAVTRFSGRTAPKHPGGIPNCADWVMAEAYSHELSSAGFWPGTGLSEAAFYSYAYPAPDGYPKATVEPEAAFYHDSLGEFILPYSAVQSVENPDNVLLKFLQSTYEAAANTGGWDREALERRSLEQFK
ncbi:MAG: DUF5996 family protein [Balneolaceae bacterium]